MHSLVVEDDFVNRKVLHKVLSKHGECDTAANGKEALEAFLLATENNTPYELICLDIMMPEMNGREALEAIRKSEKKRGLGGTETVKIIMVTASDDPKSIMGAFRDGCEAYLTKPIDVRKLTATLKELELID